MGSFEEAIRALEQEHRAVVNSLRLQLARRERHSRIELTRCSDCKGYVLNATDENVECPHCQGPLSPISRLVEPGTYIGAFGQIVEAEKKSASVEESAKVRLHQAMVKLSEERWSAEWHLGLEYAIGDDLRRLRRGASPTIFEMLEIAEIEALATAAGGLWHWPDGAEDVVFLPSHEWFAIYGGEKR